tara:strand:+ start:190 stop:360 length:171 start_codon:yes stop_codon:yes gene_type:complete
MNDTEYFEDVEVKKHIPNENTSVLMKIIIGILGALALYILVMIIIGLVNKTPTYKI